MDEILIEEKKYLSSKRAAKVTGYAKDYIGQLCREGRVPARLIGRNWYVLEAAIHDHRFGPQVATPTHTRAEEPESLSEKESPRYEALSTDEFPQIISQQQEESELASMSNEQDEPSQHLQDSWKEWFDRIADTATSIIPDVTVSEKSLESIEVEKEEEKKEVRIPIRAIHHSRYQAPPEELLPRTLTQEIQRRNSTKEEEQSMSKAQKQQKMSRRSTVVMIRVITVSLAVLSVSLAIIGSGYVDTHISDTRVGIFSGVVIYNRSVNH